jgi:hypothetical protein
MKFVADVRRNTRHFIKLFYQACDTIIEGM